jgi:2-phospho-L-lactate/phosphoenolpyruvate guanylyltransferase
VGVTSTAVLVPVKAFGQAKRRLSDVFDPDERAELAQRLATIVVRAASPLTVAVVCDDPGVAMWAAGLGALVLREPGRGLNAAVAAGVEQLGALGAQRVIVAHGDLPLAIDLASIDRGAITMVPDARHDGTNVIALPVDAGFEFAYGPGSFERHLAEAMRCGYEPVVVDDDALALDVDLPVDLERWRSHGR